MMRSARPSRPAPHSGKLEEEKAADRELSRIAEAEVNALPVVAGTEEAIEA
jgi:hypothetical protein